MKVKRSIKVFDVSLCCCGGGGEKGSVVHTGDSKDISNEQICNSDTTHNPTIHHPHHPPL